MPVRDDLPADVTTALSEYRTITSLAVQWGDMDAFGHVNNVVYIPLVRVRPHRSAGIMAV